MNIGIIGTGNHGSRYAHHIINDIPGLNLSAISRRTAVGQRQADKWGCNYYPKWSDLVEDPAIDAIIVVVPPTLNLEIARACLLQRKPLLLEKPLATSLEAGIEIVASFAKAKLGLTIGQTMRYNPMIRAAKNSIHTIGKINSIIAQHHLEPSTLTWLEDPDIAGAGVILHTAIHVFDAINYITGLEVKRVRADSYQYYNSGVEDVVSVNLEYSNGAVGFVQSSKICPARLGGYQFLGEHGLLSGDQIYNELKFIHGTSQKNIMLHPADHTIKKLLNEWFLFVTGKGQNPIPGSAGLDALRVSAASLESIKKGGWVNMEKNQESLYSQA